MIAIKEVTVKYPQRSVLDMLNIDLRPSAIHGLVGLNGAGKTTFFNVIFGLVKANNGSILFNNEPLTRRDVSFLETHNYFYSNITAREYLSLFNSDKPSNFDLKVWEDLFKIPLDEIVENFSTGMKKKLALLGILKQDKSILLLDEPFNGVDLETARIIKLLLLSLKEKGKTIIITSHILESLTNVCDYIHYLENGRVKHTYSKDQLEQIEEDIFSNFEESTRQVISNAI
jgi:ABC-2 type transport system ATP-binding protein